MSCKSRLFYIGIIALSLVSLANEVFAQDAPAIKEKPAAEEQASEKETQEEPSAQAEADENDHSGMTLDELTADFKQGYRDYVRKYRSATKAEKRNIAGTNPKAEKYRVRLIELINEDPGSQGGLDAIDWWLQRGGRTKSTDVILDLLVKNYSKLESIKKYMLYFDWKLPPEEAEKHLRLLLEVNPFDEVKANASCELHEVLKKRLEGLDDEAAESVKAEMKTLRDTVSQQYPDMADINGSLLVDRMAAFEFADNLKVGKPMPDIVGPDVEGVDFKLSDYDGKVRVVTFWGHWCGPCNAMFPHERSLVKQLADEPFALIGVNSDGDLEEARKKKVSRNITWRNFWNGEHGTAGPIATKWGVKRWPTIYVVDAKGIIRYKNVRNDDLDKAITTLLAEMGHDVKITHEHGETANDNGGTVGSKDDAVKK